MPKRLANTPSNKTGFEVITVTTVDILLTAASTKSEKPHNQRPQKLQ